MYFEGMALRFPLVWWERRWIYLIFMLFSAEEEEAVGGQTACPARRYGVLPGVGGGHLRGGGG